MIALAIAFTGLFLIFVGFTWPGVAVIAVAGFGLAFHVGGSMMARRSGVGMIRGGARRVRTGRL